MIIKTSRLQSFIKDYNEKIGTEFEWEDWDVGETHVYGFDIETKAEANELNKLTEKYQIPNN